jgi:DNA-binding NarL/FixJ family response regulator
MANQPKLVRQLLLDMLEEESCIEIVGEATQESEIRELVEKTAADLVMVTADKLDRWSAIWLELLNEFLALSRSRRTKIMPFVIGRRSIFMSTKSNHRNMDFLAQ